MISTHAVTFAPETKSPGKSEHDARKAKKSMNANKAQKANQPQCAAATHKLSV
jgi:hypothetical protein